MSSSEISEIMETEEEGYKALEIVDWEKEDEAKEKDRADKSAAVTRRRRLPSHLTKFELARVVGTRAMQIRGSGRALVPILDGDTDPVEIAWRELRAKKINFVIRRKLPDGTHEDWRVDEMSFSD